MARDANDRGNLVETSRFCYGCNEKYPGHGKRDTCPICGQSLLAIPDAPTRGGREIALRDTPIPGEEENKETQDELVGQRLGTYTVESLIGKGGMARVYLARHLMLQRACALKILNPQLVKQDDYYINLFLGEARAAAALVHPHVVTVHNIGREGDLNYIEMEFIDGLTLLKLVKNEGKLDPTRSTRLVAQTASALAAAHSVGLIHRDLKPANILVTRNDDAKLADFGLAKRIVADGSEKWDRDLAGTPHFMAPEQFAGRGASCRTDIYALGVTFYYLLTGRLPFRDPSVGQLAARHARDEIPDLPECDSEALPEITSVVRRCLAKRPEDRYDDGQALHEDLQALLGGMRDIESLIATAMEPLQTSWERRGDRFEIQVSLEGGRSQQVFIETVCEGPVSEHLVRIYSICAPLNPEYYRRALELNAKIPHGSIAIEKLQGSPYFIAQNIYPRSTCDPEEIRHSVLDVAHWADHLEERLTGADRY